MDGIISVNQYIRIQSTYTYRFISVKSKKKGKGRDTEHELWTFLFLKTISHTYEHNCEILIYMSINIKSERKNNWMIGKRSEWRDDLNNGANRLYHLVRTHIYENEVSIEET